MIFSKKDNHPNGDIFAALDIGSSKVSCTIAKLNKQYKEGIVATSVKPMDTIRVLSTASQLSQGVKNGVITDMESLEDSILNAVHNAEQMAQININKVYVNLPTEVLQSEFQKTEVGLYQKPVTSDFLSRSLKISSSNTINSTKQLISVSPIKYSIDENQGIKDPVGIMGDKLEIESHLIYASSSYVNNLLNCIGKCHLDIASFVPSPQAVGLSTLVADELELGAIIIDIGGSSTSISAFIEGNLCYFSHIPIGGINVTYDIARGLATPINQAERLKTLYGTLISSSSDERENILVTQIGEEQSAYANHIPKSFLTRIIRARVEEIIEIVASKINYELKDSLFFQRVVITGGSSQIQGVRDLATNIIGRPARLGHPQGITGVGELIQTPSFATSAGILNYALQDFLQIKNNRLMNVNKTPFFKKISKWLND